MLATLTDELSERRRRNQWTQTDELLATVYDALQVIHRDLALLGGARRSSLPRLQPFPRPGRDDVPTVSLRDLARMMLSGR